MISWARHLIYRFKHRNDTPEQKAHELQKAKTELKKAYGDLKEAFQNEPATRELMETFDSMDDLCESLEVNK